MDIQQAVQSQFLAALRMLREAIVKCPPSVWDARQDKDKFWYKAHHVLYWAQVDLRATRKGFVRWKGRYKPDAAMPISKVEILEYLASIEQQVDGLRADRLERLIGSIRHIQQHTGELYERLGTRAHVKLRWYEHVRGKSR